MNERYNISRSLTSFSFKNLMAFVAAVSVSNVAIPVPVDCTEFG